MKISVLFTDEFIKYSEEKEMFLSHYSSVAHHEDLDYLFKKIDLRNVKGVIIYPHAVRWEPVQRPQHLMREMGEKGYLCFFCDRDGDENLKIEKKFNNVYTINKEEILIEAFREHSVIFYLTWVGQYPFTKFFENKFVWYDIVDSLPTFSLGEERASIELHEQLIKKSDLVSYSSRSLKPLGRESAEYVPNGVDISLFNIGEKGNYKSERKGVIYVGAIDNKWFDWKSLIHSAKNLPDTQFSIIGKLPDKHPKLPANIELVGFVKQEELPKYLKKAKVGIIPFKKNKITDTVLPLKMFEYCMMGLPTVSTGLMELTSLSKDFLRNTYDKDSFGENIKYFLENGYREESLIDFAKEYDWSNFSKRIVESIERSVKGLKTLANIPTQGTLNVVTPTFYDWEGGNFYSGGAERYVVDLAKVARKSGYKLRLFQKGLYNWVRNYNEDLEVVAIKAKNKEELLGVNDFLNKGFYSFTQGKSLLNIYSPFTLNLPFISKPSVGISHGIYWDDGVHNGGLDEKLLESANNLDKFVSVDTNTCNWFQTRDKDLGLNLNYIPNYVDNEEFSPDRKEKFNRIIITYPRRLYAARGYYIVLDVIDKILEKHPQVDFHFVGRGFEEDTDKLKPYIKKWGNRVSWYSEDPENMHQVYKKTTISLIPTLHSEGTSLSCLEAMSSENIVVATRIGGLTDIIINRFNGFLIEPNPESLLNILNKILSNLDGYSVMRKRARETAEAFNKKYWEETWENVMKEKMREGKKLHDLEIGVVEYRYKKRKDFEKDLGKISIHLQAGKLLYIHIPKSEISEKESFGRLQFIN